MADKKISQLTTLAQADVAVTADFLPIVDTSATETKKATPQALVQAGATGATLPVALGAVGTPSYTFTGDLNTGLWSPAADTLAASTGGVEVWRVNASGNFSLGATAWTSNPFGQTTEPRYFQYSASSNVIRLAGDAGVAYTAFRFSNDGGAASLQLGKARGTYASPSAVQTNDNLGDLQFRGYGGTNSRVLANVTAFVETYTSDSDISSYLEFRTSSSGSASATEKMRLTAAGNLGIGTASPGSKLTVSGDIQILSTNYLSFSNTAQQTYIRAAASNTLAFGTSSAEVARFDSSGNLGIGTTTINYRAVADCNNAGNNDNGFAVRNANSSAYGGSYNFEHAVTGGNSPVRASYISSEGGSGNSFMRFATTVSGTLAERMRISSTGSVIAGASAALATTATDGFLYVPTCAGTPTGTPTAVTGMAPIVINTTNNKLYFYSGGAWRDAGP